MNSRPFLRPFVDQKEPTVGQVGEAVRRMAQLCPFSRFTQKTRKLASRYWPFSK